MPGYLDWLDLSCFTRCRWTFKNGVKRGKRNPSMHRPRSFFHDCILSACWVSSVRLDTIRQDTGSSSTTQRASYMSFVCGRSTWYFGGFYSLLLSMWMTCRRTFMRVYFDWWDKSHWILFDGLDMFCWNIVTEYFLLDWIFLAGVFEWLEISYWNILTDRVFVAGMSLLTRYCILC